MRVHPVRCAAQCGPARGGVVPEGVWGMCRAPSEENNLSRCTTCGAVLQKTDEVLDAVRVGQEVLDKATRLQFADPAKAHRLTTNLLPILASAGPSSHPRLALARLHTALLIAGIAESQASSSPTSTSTSTTMSCFTPTSTSAFSTLSTPAPTSGPPPANSTPQPQPQTPTRAQDTLDSAIFAATHASRRSTCGIVRAELGKLLAVDEPAPAQAGSSPSSLSSVAAAAISGALSARPPRAHAYHRTLGLFSRPASLVRCVRSS